MSTAPDDERDDAPAGSSAVHRLLQLDLELPDRGTGVRSGRAPAPARAAGPSRRWLAGFGTLLVLALVAGVALTYVGVQIIGGSTAGRTISSSLDPSEPGFEAFLEPTPTLLLAHEVDGGLASLALLGLGRDDIGGSVLLIPPSTRVEDETYVGPLTVAYAFGGGIDAIFGHVERLLGIGIAGHVVLDDARWAVLTSGVAPLAIDNPDGVGDFAEGPIELSAADVGSWLGRLEDDESELGRLFRHELFWDAWLREVAAASDAAAVPGEVESGIGRFVRGLAAGRHEIATLPVTEGSDANGEPVVQVERAAADDLVTRLIPFPRGPWEGARTRVRLLDGTGVPDHALEVAPRIVGSDAAIVVVGNADAFGQQETEVRYHQEGQREAAERLRDALGAGRVVEDARQVDAFDVTIVLGSDI